MRRIVTIYSQVMSPGPDARPLGALALLAAVVAVVLSLTYFWSPFAYLAVAVSLPLAMAARTEESSRRMGSIASVVSLLALLVATAILV